MSKVDPFVVQMPSTWRGDREIVPYITYLNRQLHDLWKRTGGGFDQVSDNKDTITSEAALIAANAIAILALENTRLKIDGTNGPVTGPLTFSAQVTANNINPGDSVTYFLGE